MRDEAPIGDCVLSAEQIRSGVAKVAALLNDAYDDAVVVTVVPGGSSSPPTSCGSWSSS